LPSCLFQDQVYNKSRRLKLKQLVPGIPFSQLVLLKKKRGKKQEEKEPLFLLPHT
jgi:hypothetical protein